MSLSKISTTQKTGIYFSTTDLVISVSLIKSTKMAALDGDVSTYELITDVKRHVLPKMVS